MTKKGLQFDLGFGWVDCEGDSIQIQNNKVSGIKRDKR